MSRPPTEPFFWRGEGLGCLLIHGFTGTPYEMRGLGERLHAGGHSALGVRLAGHASAAEALEDCTWQDWYRSAEGGLEELTSESNRGVVVIGLSMGSLLALRLAYAHAGSVIGMVLLASALELASPWPERVAAFLPAVRWLPERLRRLPKSLSDIADPEARRNHPGAGQIPLRSVAELIALQREVRPLLPRIRQPALAMHGGRDHTVPVDNLRRLQSLPGLREAIVLPRSYHVITVDVERERVAEAVLGFVADLEREAARNGAPRDAHELPRA